MIPEEPSDDEIVFSSNLEAQSVTCGEQKVRSVWTGIANPVFLLPAPGCSRPRANSRQGAWLSQLAACSPPLPPPPPLLLPDTLFLNLETQTSLEENTYLPPKPTPVQGEKIMELEDM